MKAAIAIDDWKLPIFEHRLKEAGFEFKQGPGVTADTLLLQVVTEDGAKLEKVVRAANAEAATAGKPRTGVFH